MSHTRLLLPHPVIKPDGFDYNDGCIFDTEMEASLISGSIHIKVSHNLTSSTLNDLITSKKAKFFVMINCTKTHQRVVKSYSETSISLDLPIADYADKINITPYVAAVEKISSFDSEEHDDEIRKSSPGGMDLPAGAILAVGRSNEITLDSIKSIEAAIRIMPNPDVAEGTYAIDTHDEYVEIVVHPNTQKSLEIIHDKARDLLYPSVYLTAIEHALRAMEDSSGRKWVQGLEKTLERNNIRIDFENLRSESLKHAQTILNNPLERIMKWDMTEEEDD